MDLNNSSCNEKLKKEILDRLFAIRNGNQGLIAKIKNTNSDARVTDIAQTAINKLLNDIIPQFNMAGLEFYTESKVSKAVSGQLIQYAVQGQQMLKKYNNGERPNTKEVDSKEILHLIPSNAWGRFLANLRRKFIKPKNKKQTVMQESTDITGGYMAQYEDLTRQVATYNLRDNIISTLIQEICPENGYIYFAPEVPNFMENDIAPTLTRLGMEDIIPRLEEQIIAAYEKIEEDRLGHCVTKEERSMYAPNFEEYRTKNKSKISRQTSKNLNGKVVVAERMEGGVTNEGLEPGED